MEETLQELTDAEPTRNVSSESQQQTERSRNAKLTPHIWGVLSYVVAMSKKLPWSVHVERRLERGIRDIGAILPIALVTRLDGASRQLGQSRSATVTQAVARFLERRSQDGQEG